MVGLSTVQESSLLHPANNTTSKRKPRDLKAAFMINNFLLEIPGEKDVLPEEDRIL
jgi:hypothetical protein